MINVSKPPVPPSMVINGLRMYTAAEFARHARVRPTSVWLEINAGYLRTSIIDNTIYIASTELVAFAMRNDSAL